MRVKFAAYLLLFISTVIISCSKDDVKPEEQDQSGSSLFVRIQQGINPEDDSVYLISYDANKRIKSITDSISEDVLTPAYDGKGNLSSTKYTYEVNGSVFSSTVTFTYNGADQLTEVYVATEPSRYTFEYTNGVISKKSYFIQTNANSPALNLWRYWTYEMTDGNITSMKEYNSAGSLVKETTFTYTSEPNVFKPIALINFSNYTGMLELANEDNFFNKNLIATSTEGDMKTVFTYTYNSRKQLTKAIVDGPDGIYTRMFSF